MSALRVISLGAGVQSTAVLMLALAGDLGQVDAAVFADTGWEPRAVYAHLWGLAERCAAAGLPLHIVSGGNIRNVTAMGTGGGMDAPFYVTNRDGSEGMLRRQCTSKFKIGPIRREVRRLLAAAGETRCEQLFGISADEVQRMRTSDVKYVTHAYPLVDRGWRRSDCVAYLAGLGIDAPRSACIGCPYRSDREWRALAPDELADAAAWEREAQEHGFKVDGTPYVHRSRVPLLDVDLSTPEERGQLSIDDECAGVCWT